MIYEIYRYIYANRCDDSYYGKQTTKRIIGYVSDTEENVKNLVDKLNQLNHSYHALKLSAQEMEDYCGDDYMDEDYISYKEVKISTMEDIENRYK